MNVTRSNGKVQRTPWAWAIGSAIVLTATAAGAMEEYLGPCDVVASKDAKTLYVANADARQLAYVELSTGKVTRRVDMPAEPTGLALSPDGTKLVVTCAAPKSTVVVIDTVWDLMNDGASNPKSTKSMILAPRTPPAMAEGVRPTAEAAVRASIQHILFADRPEEEAAAIDAYLESLAPVPSPYLVDGRLSRAAQRGRRLFESSRVGCYRCHPAPLYTDLKMHNVGTKSPYGYTERFDTPTLVEVWRTVPYLHDGRYTTVKELIAKGKHGKTRGRVEELSESEIDDLVEFVLSL